MSRSIHPERHYSSRNNWLRAGVLGANDGLISTASLLMGTVAGGTDGRTLVLSGIAARWQAPSPCQPANTSRSPASPTPNGPTWPRSVRNWTATPKPSCAS
ncbi:VIT1/CCC1 transporter family protein [Lautropia mirabilis]